MMHCWLYCICAEMLNRLLVSVYVKLNKTESTDELRNDAKRLTFAPRKSEEFKNVKLLFVHIIIQIIYIIK